MTQLPIDQSIPRFAANEEKVDVFVNDPLNVGYYTTNETSPRQVESLPHLVDRIASRHLQVVYEGYWITSTAYSVNDLVKESSVVYICVEAHTSGTFTTDLSSGKWKVFQANDADEIDYLASFTGAVARTQHDKNAEWVSVKDFGADSTGTYFSTDSFLAAIAYCGANQTGLLIPSGTYKLPAGETINFGCTNLKIRGEGNAILKYVGTGKGFYCSSPTLTEGGWIHGMSIENLRILGEPTVTDGCFLGAIVRSNFKDIDVKECNNNAFVIYGGVSNTYINLKYSNPHGTTHPTNGFYLGEAYAGAYTADCTFINCIAEDFPGRGLWIVKGSGNTFIGGTFESVGTGITISSGCRLNSFSGIWFEQNTIKDIEVAGTSNLFENNNCISNGSSGCVIISGDNNVFNGGYFVKAEIQSSSIGSIFNGCAMEQHPALGFQGAGKYSRLSCIKVDNAGEYVAPFNNILNDTESITFKESGVASKTSNVLDIYEEGLATVGLNCGTSGTITLNTTYNKLAYTKIGRQVTVTGILIVDSVSSPLGDLLLTPLPFTSANDLNIGRATGSIHANGLATSATGQIMLRMVPSTYYAYLEKYESGTTQAMAADVKAGSVFYISLTYFTD